MFDRKPNLVRHRRVHQAKVLNLVCSKCAKTFSNASNLKTHLNDVHFEKKMDKPKMALVSNKGDTFFKVFFYYYSEFYLILKNIRELLRSNSLLQVLRQNRTIQILRQNRNVIAMCPMNCHSWKEENGRTIYMFDTRWNRHQSDER